MDSGAVCLGSEESIDEVIVLLIAAHDMGALCEQVCAEAHARGVPFRVCAEDDILPGTVSVITLREAAPLSDADRQAAGIGEVPHLRVGNAHYTFKAEGPRVAEQPCIAYAFDLAKLVFDLKTASPEQRAEFEREWAARS